MIKEILLKLGLDASGAKGSLKDVGEEVEDLKKKTDEAKRASKQFSETIDNLPGPAGQAAQGIKLLVNQLKILIATPAGRILGALTIVLGSLIAIFKDFAPLVDFISDKIAYLSGAFKGLQTAMYDFATGAGFTTQAINEQADAAERANRMLRDYEDNISSFNLKQAQYEAQIDKLLKQAKNKEISDQKSLELIKEASKLQDQQIKEQQDNARKETAILVEKAKAAGATYKQILAIQKGATIESLNNVKDGADDELKALQENYAKRVVEFSNLDQKKVKIENAEAARNEKIKAGQEKDAADRLKKAEEEKKRQEAEGKDRAERAKEYDEKVKKQQEYERERKRSLDTADREKYEQDVADLKAIKDDELLKDKERFAAIDELRAKGILSEKEAADAKVKIAQAESDAKIALLNGYSSVLMSISDLAGRETVAGKALAVAATTIDTYVAAFRAYKEGFKVDPTGTLSIINASAATITGIAAVRKILSVQVPNGGGGGGGSAPSLSLPTTRPSSGFTTLGNENPLRTTNEGGMVKVFVTESDITNSQNKVSSIQAKATIG